jgi:hypothetical protein
LIPVEGRLLTFTTRSSQVLRRFRQRRPKWVNPLEFLDPELQNLFDLAYFHESGTAVPTGWNSTTDEGALPRLSSRQPKVAVSDTEMRTPEPVDRSDESGSEDSVAAPAPTRMNDESSDEDMGFLKAKVRDQLPAADVDCSLTDGMLFCVSRVSKPNETAEEALETRSGARRLGRTENRARDSSRSNVLGACRSRWRSSPSMLRMPPYLVVP